MSKLPPDLVTVTTVGLDLAKHVFYVHAVDGADRPVKARMLRRRDVMPFFASLPHSSIGYLPPAPEAILPRPAGLPYASLRSAHQGDHNRRNSLSSGGLA